MKKTASMHLTVGLGVLFGLGLIIFGIQKYIFFASALALPPLNIIERDISKGCGPFGFLTLNRCYKHDYYIVDRPFNEYAPTVVSSLQAQGYTVNYDSSPGESSYAFKDGKKLYINFDLPEYAIEGIERNSKIYECYARESCSVVFIEQ